MKSNNITLTDKKSGYVYPLFHVKWIRDFKVPVHNGPEQVITSDAELWAEQGRPRKGDGFTLTISDRKLSVEVMNVDAVPLTGEKKELTKISVLTHGSIMPNQPPKPTLISPRPRR